MHRRHADAARNVHIAFAINLQGRDVVRYQAAAAVRVALLKNRVALLACVSAKHSQKDSTNARSSAVVATAIASRAVMLLPLSGLQLAATVFPGRNAGSVASRSRMAAVSQRISRDASRLRWLEALLLSPVCSQSPRAKTPREPTGVRRSHSGAVHGCCELRFLVSS